MHTPFRALAAIAFGSTIFLTSVPGLSPARAAPLAAVPRCDTSQLSANFVSSNGGVGHIGNTYRFHNHSKKACTLYGYPGAQLLNAQKKPMATHYYRGGGYLGGAQKPRLVTLAPGGNAFFLLQYSDVPVGKETRCPTSKFLKLTPPNAYAAMIINAGPGGIGACGGGSITVSAVQPKNVF